jgi:DNA topoisomerase-1
MARPLVIVESPAKARTLARFLGREYTVRASMGHVRDLPKGRLAVDTARGFEVEYEVLAARRKAVAELRAAAREAGTIFLAADPDREGEAICWHLAETLGGPATRYRRVAFHEVTPRAVSEAFGAPREIDVRRVDAQQTRRVVDRLVGYSLSPLLWRAVQPGLSAGRVQSVALRLVCDRERERLAFRPEEHWAIRVHLDSGTPPVFPATLVRVGTAEADPRDAQAAEALRRVLEAARYRVAGVERRERRRPAPPPFVTSTLQQEAFRRLRFAVKKTMQVAQQLYEGVELPGAGPVGLVTYMRTDSVRVSPEAIAALRAHVARSHGPEYVPATANVFRSSTSAQDAHEAIRPTDLARTPASLESLLPRDALLLYTLVYDRFVASQMAPAVYDETIVDVEARPRDADDRAPASHGLRAKGSVLRFRGFLAAYEDEPEAAPRGAKGPPGGSDPATPLPPLVPGQPLSAVRVDAEQRFTEPPPRFTEASLVKELEKRGIGRPSTYAAILATLDAREYVKKEKGRLAPTPLGFTVTDLLVERFPELLSVRYTASLEAVLDAIEEGRETRLAALVAFWRRFAPALAAAGARPAAAATDAPADAPGRPGRRSPTRPLAAEATAAGPRPERPSVDPSLGPCPTCGAGLSRRPGRYGTFVGCSRYPACRFVQRKAADGTGVRCPGCHEGELVARAAAKDGRRFYGCSRYPACRFTETHRPLAESCPACGRSYLLARETKADGRVVFCGSEDCTYHRGE